MTRTSHDEVQKAAAQREREVIARRMSLRRVCNTEDGLRLLWELIEENGMFQPITVGNPEVTAARLGKLSVAQKVWASLYELGGMALLSKAEAAYRAPLEDEVAP